MIKGDVGRRRSFIINFVYFGIIVVVVYALARFGLPLLSPFVVGFIFACMLQRPIKFLHRNLHMNKKLGGVLVSFVFFVILTGLVFLVGAELFSRIQSLLQALPDIYSNSIEPVMIDIFNSLNQTSIWKNPNVQALADTMEDQVLDSLGNLASTISMGAVGFISSFAASIPVIFVKLVLMIISTVFISMEYDRIMDFCIKQMSDTTRNMFMEVKSYLVGTLFVCIRSYALIMGITFVELSIGLTVIGIENSILIALAIAVFDILPVLGTGGIMVPWAAVNVVLGNYSLAISLFIVYVIITIVRNIIEPKIVGSQLGIHPIVTLASMFAGVQLLGAVGLFGFPIFLSLLCHLNRKGLIKIFK